MGVYRRSLRLARKRCDFTLDSLYKILYIVVLSGCSCRNHYSSFSSVLAVALLRPWGQETHRESRGILSKIVESVTRPSQ
ncbi:hypothetical protein KSP40_PGU000794 [Platanthera guangdongensis]|uniref:Uncharacterized protein n=1 Tax=Platanthera guangdongensis TaxID=2320717 RepID=A0ABR2MJ76_9ASPA